MHLLSESYLQGLVWLVGLVECVIGRIGDWQNRDIGILVGLLRHARRDWSRWSTYPTYGMLMNLFRDARCDWLWCSNG